MSYAVVLHLLTQFLVNAPKIYDVPVLGSITGRLSIKRNNVMSLFHKYIIASDPAVIRIYHLIVKKNGKEQNSRHKINFFIEKSMILDSPLLKWQSISTYILLVWVTSCEYQMYTHELVPSVGLFQLNNSHPYQAPPAIQVPLLLFFGGL